MADLVQNIRTAIITKLDSIVDINYVYGYAKGKSEGYPYAVVTRLDSTVEFADFSGASKRNKRTYRFGVDVFTEMNEATFGSEKAENINNGIIDDVLGVFDMDTTLGGILLYSTLELQENPRYDISGNIVNIASFTFEGVQLVESN